MEKTRGRVEELSPHNNLLVQPWPSSCWPAHRMGIYSNPLINVLIQHTFIINLGKNLVFAMTIKYIPEFSRNQEIPEKFWKTYEQVKLDLFQIKKKNYS